MKNVNPRLCRLYTGLFHFLKQNPLFLLNTLLISGLEVRELISQVDNPPAGEKVQYLFL
jgi:hypothetical protein